MRGAAESKGPIRLSEEEEQALLRRYAAALAADPEFRAESDRIKRELEAGRLPDDEQVRTAGGHGSGLG